MTEQLLRSREWLLLNAVEAWLFNYESVGDVPTVEQYKLLRNEFHDAYMQTLHSEPASCLKDAEEPTPVEPEPKPTTRRSNAKANNPK